MTENEKILVKTYELLRMLMKELDCQAEYVDRQLLEIERLLPDEYKYPGDSVP